MGMRVTGLDELQRTLTGAASAAPREVTAVVSKGALNIKNDWRRAWQGLAHAPALPRAISYDVSQTLRGPEAEIGPDKDRSQGALGNIIEFGTVNNAPRPGGLPALQREEPKFVAALEALCADLLGGPR